MSEHDSEHSSFIKTPQQLIAVIVLSFVVPIAIIGVLASLASHSIDPGAAAQSAEAVAKRLKPVGEVVVSNEPAPPEPQASATPAATPGAPTASPAAVGASAAAAPGAAPAGAANGKSVYDASCVACHGTGAAGAPKLGDKAAWAPRLKEGMPHLYDSALKGKNAMPPKGGNMSLSEADVKAAVDFLANQAK